MVYEAVNWGLAFKLELAHSLCYFFSLLKNIDCDDLQCSASTNLLFLLKLVLHTKSYCICVFTIVFDSNV